MNTQIIVLAFGFLFFVVLIWFGRSWDAQNSARIWLEEHWRALVIVLFLALLVYGLLAA